MKRVHEYWDAWRGGIVILMVSLLILFLAFLPFQFVSIFFDGPKNETKDLIVLVLAVPALVILAPILAYKILFDWFSWTTQHLLRKAGYTKKER